MKLSIIIPVYNVENYLAACVDSLLAQTMRDLEILLVDDGSTDSSGAIADAYAAKNPGMIRCLHVENGGQGRARNLALPLARGEFLGFVDSDDWVRPDMYEKLCARAEETGADIVACDFLERYDDGREKTVPAAFQDHPLSFAGSCCNKIFRASLVKDLRFPEGLWYEDFAFSALALSRAGKLARVPEPLYCYRIGHPSTMHNQNARKNLDLLAVLDLLRKPMRDAGRGDDYETLVLGHALLDAINRVQRQEGKEKFTVIKKIRDYVNQEIPDLSPAIRHPVAPEGRSRLSLRDPLSIG